MTLQDIELRLKTEGNPRERSAIRSAMYFFGPDADAETVKKDCDTSAGNMGMSMDVMKRIVAAADNHPTATQRSRLLKACGLSE